MQPRFHPVLPSLRYHVTREMPALDAATEAAIDAIWTPRAEAGGLWNGRVFSADRIAPARIDGHWTEYRRVVAQMHGLPLGLRPAAVGGLIVAPDGVVFARRPAAAIYQPGQWQLPPAGSIDPGCRDEACRDAGGIDPLRQLHAELLEELGLPPAAVTAPRLLGLVEHAASHVLDLGIALATSLPADALRAAHATARDAEYAALRFVKVRDLPAFLEAEAGQVTVQAAFFLRAAGLLGETGQP